MPALAINQTISYYLNSIVRRRKPICEEIERPVPRSGMGWSRHTKAARMTRRERKDPEQAKMTVAKTTAKTKPTRTAPRSSGRPTKEQAGRIAEQIVDVAMRLFLESSFEAVSVDLIAA